MPTAAKQGSTVRISDRAHQTLRELASTSGEPMQTVLDKALEQYRRQRFWDEVDAAYTPFGKTRRSGRSISRNLRSGIGRSWTVLTPMKSGTKTAA